MNYKPLFLVVALLFTSSICHAAPDPFLPTWKLLSPQEKQQFIAGYLFGWKDAAVVTDIATEYVRDNPQRAVEGLQKIRSLYDMNNLKPALVAQQIDDFFADPANSSAGLSQAISTAKQRLQ